MKEQNGNDMEKATLLRSGSDSYNLQLNSINSSSWDPAGIVYLFISITYLHNQARQHHCFPLCFDLAPLISSNFDLLCHNTSFLPAWFLLKTYLG